MLQSGSNMREREKKAVNSKRYKTEKGARADVSQSL
jgi:hypothetical protein